MASVFKKPCALQTVSLQAEQVTETAGETRLLGVGEVSSFFFVVA